MNNVVVIGGTGFIGVHLIKELKKTGYGVVCLTRHPEGARAKTGLDVEFVGWDGRSPEGWKDAAEGALAVINLAGANIGSGRWTKKRRALLRMSRMNSGRSVSEAVRSLGVPPKVVVQASAIGYYGSQGESELTESSPIGKDFLSELCREWEESSRGVESVGVRHVVIRSGLVLGDSAGVLPRFLKIFRLYLGGPLGSGRQWLSWIHMFDEVRALLFLLEREDLSGAFNLVAPYPVRMKDFSRTLGRTLSKPSWLPVPSSALKMVLGKMAEETILTSQKVSPKRLLEAGFEFGFSRLKQALMDIL